MNYNSFWNKSKMNYNSFYQLYYNYGSTYKRCKPSKLGG